MNDELKEIVDRVLNKHCYLTDGGWRISTFKETGTIEFIANDVAAAIRSRFCLEEHTYCDFKSVKEGEWTGGSCICEQRHNSKECVVCGQPKPGPASGEEVKEDE